MSTALHSAAYPLNAVRESLDSNISRQATYNSQVAMSPQLANPMQKDWPPLVCLAGVNPHISMVRKLWSSTKLFTVSITATQGL